MKFSKSLFIIEKEIDRLKNLWNKKHDVKTLVLIEDLTNEMNELKTISNLLDGYKPSRPIGEVDSYRGKKTITYRCPNCDSIIGEYKSHEVCSKCSTIIDWGII